MLSSIINVKMAKPAGWGAADFVAEIYLPSEMKIRPDLRLIFRGHGGVGSICLLLKIGCGLYNSFHQLLLAQNSFLSEQGMRRWTTHWVLRPLSLF